MAPGVLAAYFARDTDARSAPTTCSLASLFITSLAALACGAGSFAGIERFAHGREAWLRSFLDLPPELPSHATIARLWAALDRRALSDAFRDFVAAIARARQAAAGTEGQVDTRWLAGAAAHALGDGVGGWATADHVVFAAARAKDRPDPATAMARLVDRLALAGTLVTVDAKEGAPELARRLIEAKADYLMAVKPGQPPAHDPMVRLFDSARSRPAVLALMDACEEPGDAGGLARRCWTAPAIDALTTWREWKNLGGVALVETDSAGDRSGARTERRYFLGSRKSLPARDALSAVLAGSEVRSEAAWTLTVSLGGDEQRRLRAAQAVENFDLLRERAETLVRSVPSPRTNIRLRQIDAGKDDEFLARVLGARPVAR